MPKLNPTKCFYCGGCSAVCNLNAITIYENKLEINDDCTNCYLCIKVCPVGAMEKNKIS